MSTPCLTHTPARLRFLSIEAFAILATGVVIGMAWWMGGLNAGRRDEPATCLAGNQVTSAQVEEARDRVLWAAERARYTALSGSAYAAAKVGLPRSSPEYRLAQEAAAELALARQDLARLCGGAR